MAFTLAQAATNGNEITGTGSYALTAFGSAVTVGNNIVVRVSSDGNSANQVTSLTDNKGNTYVKDAETVNTLQSTERYISIWRAVVTTGGTGLVITVNYNGASSNNSGAIAEEWAASAGTMTLDKTAGGGSTTATASPTTATTAATTQANELIIAAFVSNSTQTSFTAGTGYSNASSVNVSNANIATESKTVSATGTQVATGTFGTARAYGAIIATYYEAVAGAAANSGFFGLM